LAASGGVQGMINPIAIASFSTLLGGHGVC